MLGNTHKLLMAQHNQLQPGGSLGANSTQESNVGCSSKATQVISRGNTVLQP